MEQQDTNQKGFTERQPNCTNQDSLHASFWPSALRCKEVDQLALGSKIQLGSCCCAGPVRDAQGRRYAPFPAMRYRH